MDRAKDDGSEELPIDSSSPLEITSTGKIPPWNSASINRKGKKWRNNGCHLVTDWIIYALKDYKQPWLINQQKIYWMKYSAKDHDSIIIKWGQQPRKHKLSRHSLEEENYINVFIYLFKNNS